MLLSEIKKIYSNIEVVRDAEFVKTYLVGKNAVHDCSVVAFLLKDKFLNGLLNEGVECVICTQAICDVIKNKYSGGIAVCDDPKTCFFIVHNYLVENTRSDKATFIDPSANIHPTAIVAEKNVIIGKNTVIEAFAVVKENVQIGENCHIFENVVLGTPGFYYFGNGNNKTLVTPAGGLIIGNNVNIHPQSSIEAGVVVGNTVIGDNTKIDNTCLIGHDSLIGTNCTIAAGTTFAGGVIFGDGSFAGVGVTVAPSVVVGKNVTISSGSVLTKLVKDGTHVSGNFAVEHSRFIKHVKEIANSDKYLD